MDSVIIYTTERTNIGGLLMSIFKPHQILKDTADKFNLKQNDFVHKSKWEEIHTYDLHLMLSICELNISVEKEFDLTK